MSHLRLIRRSRAGYGKTIQSSQQSSWDDNRISANLVPQKVLVMRMQNNQCSPSIPLVHSRHSSSSDERPPHFPFPPRHKFSHAEKQHERRQQVDHKAHNIKRNIPEYPRDAHNKAFQIKRRKDRKDITYSLISSITTCPNRFTTDQHTSYSVPVRQGKQLECFIRRCFISWHLSFDCVNRAMRFVNKNNDSSDDAWHIETHSFYEGGSCTRIPLKQLPRV